MEVQISDTLKNEECKLYESQITEELRSSIENILKEFETQNNINIFFACDTGSRALGVAVESSDFDLNGFFIPHYKEYLKIIRKSPTIISKTGFKFILEGKTFELDLQLWDIREWLKDKVEKNTLGCDYWFESPIIYRNFHTEIISEIKNLIQPPFYYYWGKFKNNFDLCEKEIKKDGTQNKKIMNTLIYCTQYLHSRIFNGFPHFNIFREIDFFLDNLDKINNDNSLTYDEIKNVIEIFDYIKICYEEKKKGRKSLTNVIPQFIKTFINLLNSKFNGRVLKHSIENVWTIDIAQNIFNKLLMIYK